MKGIIRKIDALGRIVIPKEMRKALNLKTNSPLTIELNDEKIILSHSQDDRIGKLLARACAEIEKQTGSKSYAVMDGRYVHGDGVVGMAISVELQNLGNRKTDDIEILRLAPTVFAENMCFMPFKLSEIDCAVIIPQLSVKVAEYAIDLMLSVINNA